MPPALLASHVLAVLLLLAEARQSPPATPTPSPGGAPRPMARPTRPVLARRLCDALHALPTARQAQCCRASPLPSLAGVCAETLSASLRQGAVSLDAARVDRCATEAARQLEGCGWVAPVLPDLTQACQGVVRGRLAAGAACRSSLECPERHFCKGLAPGRPGACAPRGPARTRCEVPSDPLAAFTRAVDDPAHAVCDGVCVKGQCAPLAPAGGACQTAAQCAPGLGCLAGRCETGDLPAIGEACAGQAGCQAGAYCEGGRCRRLKDAGETCALPFECRALECAKAPGAPAGTCGDPCRAAAAASGR
jgi:hypothetical protein